MVYYFPSEPERFEGADTLTPRQIVTELDRFIIGQRAAKRAVAIALRNRLRRQKLAPELAEEVAPKNILMIGPTGVGKTEIARRLARLAHSPFLKVEASKFTEVGYVGRDVESMVRDLVHIAAEMVRSEETAAIRSRAERAVEERLLDLLLPGAVAPAEPMSGTREKLRRQLKAGELEERMVEIQTRASAGPAIEVFSAAGIEEMDFKIQDLLGNLMPGRSKSTHVPIHEALKILQREEESKLVDADRVARQAIERVEQGGIIFLDEIDKISGREAGRGPDVSREGVQRDLLPIIEGTTVKTRYGMVRTDHVLFIGAGAFHVSKPADLIPELQGRFPIRVELSPLDESDFVRILTEPENSLVKQYIALLGTEGIALAFAEDAIQAIAACAAAVNRSAENIGARRLHTVMEKLVEEISFEGPDLPDKRVLIDAAYVEKQLGDLVRDQDLSRYIL